jgi:hypothetical protein
MSNWLAVATVTATLRNLLFAGVTADVPGTVVTTRPPDRARVNTTANQLNLFLYQTVIEASWRNQEIPSKVKPGEIGAPPMPLMLHYLLTAYSDTDDDLNSHRLLGRAVGILHDHARLERVELRDALAGNDLYQQVERVHVTPQPMTVEELSKLWTTFQTPLRISAAYQACVVLIESTLPVRAALPVLTRGEGDTGPIATTGMAPVIDRVEYDGGQPVARPGGGIVLRGRNLAGENPRVLLQHLRLPARLEVAPTSVTGETVEVTLPTAPDALPAGTYTLMLALGIGARTITTDPIAFGLAPVVVTGLPASVARVNGVATIALTIDPPLVAGQDAALLIGGQAVAGQRVAPDQLSFEVADLEVRDYFVRVRVDGADSTIVDFTAATPQYDATQKVTVTA